LGKKSVLNKEEGAVVELDVLLDVEADVPLLELLFVEPHQEYLPLLLAEVVMDHLEQVENLVAALLAVYAQTRVQELYRVSVVPRLFMQHVQVVVPHEVALREQPETRWQRERVVPELVHYLDLL